MAHVFISYSSRHRELTRQLAERLVAEGYPVWWDHALESWGAYEPQIRAALDAASAVVVIWSAGAAASRFVKAEVEKALRLGKLVNLRAPDFPLAEVPLNYAAVDHIQTLDLADLKPVLRTLQTVWQGKVPPGARPMHETYRDLYGEDLFDPRRRDLPEDPAMVTPSVLLQAPYEVAGYADANGALADMLDWCTGRGAYLDATRPSAGRLAHGPGGMGKTRLMIETVRRLRAEGWLAGFYPAAVPNEAARMKHRQHAIEQVMSGGPEPGVLMVLDYAESRWADVIGLARMASQRPRDSGRPLRIVLLSRGAAWWQDLYRTEPEVQVLFNRRGAPHGDIRESGALPTGDERLQVFDAMRAALTPLLVHQAGAGLFPPLQQGPLPGDRRARLAEGAAFARPLALQMEALLSLAGSAGEEVADLLESVLALERRHWRKVIDGLAPGDRREGAMRRGISQITALGGTADRPGTERLLAADSYFGTRARVDLPMAELRRLYAAGSEGVAALEPDLIGEHELLLSGDEALLDACRDWIAALPEPDRAARRRTLFTVLHRATRAEHGARAAGAEAFLAHAVAGMTTGEAPALVAAAIETPGPLPRLLTEAVPRLPAEVLEALAKAMPAQTVALLGLADAVAGQRLNAARARMDAEAGSEQAHADLARCLANRGKTLQGLGQREAALAATEEAVAIRRRLAAARPDEFEPDLARSLNNLGVDLSNLGQREAALVATEEAMAIRRRLAAARPDAFEPDLAVSLSNLGVDLSSLGQREAALEAT
ncbi:MAG: toll/interleukin-1 receptor domain-containing protein, partial [Methylocystis sp.]|nr:toll/interleukin-1 receptor domain-containing protein [Methylocystis sp.]